MSMIEESNEIKRLLNNLVDKEIDEKSKECLRLYKAVVTSVATQSGNKWYIGVKIAPHTTAADNSITILSTYMCKNCAVGDYVWVAKMYNSMNNAFAMYPMDFIFGTDYSGSGGNYLPLSAGSSYPLTGTLYTQAILPNIAGYQIGSATQYFGDIYAVDYKLKNKTNAYSDTPTNPSTNYIDFLDKNNVEFARIYVQIGQGYNGLNFILKNKSNADNRLAFFYDSSGWYFRSSNDKATNLGANTLRWNNIWGKHIVSRDTTPNFSAYIEGDSYTATPTADKSAQYLARDDSGNFLGGMRFFHKTTNHYQVQLFARNHNTGYSSLVCFETSANATSSGQASYSRFVPGYNNKIDLGNTNTIWQFTYSREFRTKNISYARDETPTSNSWIGKFTTIDKNNTTFSNIGAGIGTNFNALEMGVHSKNGTYGNVRLIAKGLSNETPTWCFSPAGVTNGTIDLGETGSRFKSLYLANNLYLYNKTITNVTNTWTFPNSTGTVALKEELGGLSNPNFIINSNFKINQRGAASYNTRQKFTVDRWFISSSTTNPFTVTPLSAVDGGINITGSSISYASYLNQYIEIDSSYFSGKTLTLSCYVESITGSLELGFASNFMVLTTGLNKLTFTATGTAGEFKDIKFMRSKNTSCNANIKWVKLEETSFYTTYIPPDPILELVKCQRYFIRIANNQNQPYYQFANVFGDGTNARAIIPATLRTNPTISSSGNFIIITMNNTYISVTGFTTQAFNTNSIVIKATTSSSMTNGLIGTLESNNSVGAHIDLDAEIYSYNG